MGSNILKLCDVEFQRIKKGYFLSLVMFFLLNVFTVFNALKELTIASIGGYEFTTIDINALRNHSEQEIAFYIHILMKAFDNMSIVLGIFVLFILIFCVIIWYRDFNDKTIFTLFSLPQNRMNIFISKFLISVNMIFGYMIFSMILIFLDVYFIDLLIGVNLFDYHALFNFSMLIRFNYIDFFVIDFLGVISAVSLLFTTTLFSLKSKKLGKIISPIIVSMSLYIFLYVTARYRHHIDILTFHIIYLLLISIFSWIMSNKLINKIDL